MDFILIAILASIGMAIALAILGNIVLWKKISYLGDSIAHSALLGIVLSLLLNINDMFIITIVCFIFSLSFIFLHKRFGITKDSLLIFNTQLSLSLAFILLSIFNGKMLNNYFFGSILSLSIKELIIIYILLIIIILGIVIFWNKILLVSFNHEIANAEGINSNIFEVILIFVLSFIITISIKFVGVLLVPSLLILPALFSLNLTNNPSYTLILSSIIATIAVIAGIAISTFINIAPSPVISLFLVLAILIKLLITYLLGLLEE